MRIVLRKLILPIFILASCCNGNGQGDTVSGYAIEKKYYLKECIIRVELKWNESIDANNKFNILRKVDEQLKHVIVSNKFPLFSNHYSPSNPKYYVIYFANQCEKRRELTQELINKYILPSVPEFPKYIIEDKGFDPGFDGVLPSGWWIKN